MTTNAIIYDAGQAGIAVLQTPTVTVAHNTEISNFIKFTVLVKITYTIRALITAENSAALRSQIESLRTVLNVSGGILRGQYGNDINFLQADPSTDVVGGPHPLYLEIREIYGGRSATVVWTIQTQKHVRDDNVSAVGAWLDFAYTISTSLNLNAYATRTISGVLRISACHQQTANRSADAFRYTVEQSIAPVPTNGVWQRVTREYRLSEDRRVLAFTIVDVQLYASLPNGITSGDIAISVISEKGGFGRYILNGWFEAPPDKSRSDVQAYVREIWQLFYNLVVQRIESETTGDSQWSITNERRSYTARLSSNRIDFEASYEVRGEWEHGIPDNIEYTVSRGLEWLAYLSRLYNQPIVDMGPYGSAPTIGPTGLESPGPIILIDPIEKLPAGFAYVLDSSQLATRGDKQNQVQGAAIQGSYLSWHQSYKYDFDPGVVALPRKGEGLTDILQQVRNPSILLTVVGEAEAIGTEIDLTAQLFPNVKVNALTENQSEQTTPQVVLMASSFTTENPSSAGIYKIKWTQLYRFYITGKTIPLKWPQTPLYTEQAAVLVQPTIEQLSLGSLE